MEAGAHELHKDKEGALSIDHLHEVILHLDDVGVVQLRNNAQLSVLVLGILDHLLEGVLLMRPLVDHQVDLAESTLADQLNLFILMLLRRLDNTSERGLIGRRFSK